MNSAERVRGYERRLQMEREGFLGGLAWRSVGPEIQGGRVVAITAPARDPEKLYVAYATGGLWRSEDRGISWTPLFEDQSSFGIGAVAVSSDGKTLWVGSGEANSQRTSYQGTGVFKSADEGKTWQNVGLVDTNHIGRIKLDPRNENVAYVAAIGHLYTHNDMRGIFKTADGGKTWQQILKLGPTTGAIDVEIDPGRPDTVYAAAWERERRAWDFRDMGRGSGVFRSTDAGKTWQKVSDGLPQGALGRIGLATTPSKSGVVYAFVDNFNPNPDELFEDEYIRPGTLTVRRFLKLDEELFLKLDTNLLDRFFRQYMPQDFTVANAIEGVKSGSLKMADLYEKIAQRNPNPLRLGYVEHEIYRSDDFGRTWKRSHEYRFGNHGGYYWGKIRVSPHDPNDVMTTGVPLLRSRNGGKTWAREAPQAHVDFHDVWYDPRNPKRILVGNDGGLYETGDDGEHWRHLNNVSVGQFTTIAVDMKTPYNIYGGLQDNGTMKGPSNYNPGRSPLHQWQAIGGGDGSWVALDPRNGGDVVYIASQFGAHSAIDQASGQRWSTRPPNPRGEDPNRFNWVSPFIVSPHHPDVVYVGSQRVWRSLDMGKKWTAISGDITRNKPNGDVPFSTLKVLDESPFKFGLLYAGCDDGRVMMTPDMGETWVDVSTPEPEKWVSRVIASKWDANTVYVTQSGYRDDDYRPYVWKSTDRGKTWTSIAGDLPHEFVNVIREDPVDKRLLYVGTGMGVFVSFDGGNHWEPLFTGLPRCAVHDIVIHARDLDLVAGTHGRSVYVVKIKPLHELTDEVREEPLHLFAASDVRRDPNLEMRRRTPYAEPEDPRLTATGWVWTQTAGKATVRVVDGDKKVVIETQLDLRKGLQQYEIDLKLRSSSAPTEDPRKRKPKTLEEALSDAFSQTRPEYLKIGSYSLEFELSGVKSTTTLKLAAPEPGQGFGRGGDADG